MFLAKRAIIMAAGKGTRLAPLTDETPKPLLAVNGRPLICSAIDALRANGIAEIHVVVGYKKEQFAFLADRYPGLTFVENPLYDSANNISSLYAARAFLADTVILDGDMVIENPDVFRPAFARSGYCCTWVTRHTDEWLLQTDGEGAVVSCSRTGGSTGWQLYSVSFWSEADGRQLARDLEDVFLREGRTDIYWDDVALFCRPRHYRLGVREIGPGDIVEIDTLAELAARDANYQTAWEKAHGKAN